MVAVDIPVGQFYAGACPAPTLQHRNKSVVLHVWRNVRCLDPGLEDGGVGGVAYRIRSEKTA